MMIVSTEYKLPTGEVFAADIICGSEEEANQLIAKRNLGERVVGFPSYNAPNVFSASSDMELRQELCFTAWMDIKSGTQVDEVIGPKGWLTQYLGAKAFPGEPVLPQVQELTQKINACRESLGMPRIRKI